MKGETFLRIIVILLIVAVAGYLLISLIPDPTNSYTTYKAVHYEVGGITTSGFVVRSEQPVTGGAGSIVVLTRSEGEKVAKGYPVASTFRDESARDRQDQIDRLEQELAQMNYAYSFSSSGADSATLDADILHLMNQVTVYHARRENEFADSAAEDLKSTVLRRYLSADDARTLWQRISETKERLNELYAQAKAESGTVRATVSGYFSGVTDGYEGVLTPDFLETATVSQFRAARPDQAAVAGAIGKLVTSPKWYYVAVVSPKEISGIKLGDRIDVSFVYDFYQSVRMRVERISPSEDGACLLILSSQQSIQNAVSTRKQTADLLTEETSGLLVPKAAIYADTDGTSCVYVLDGATARKKTVQIIKDIGEQYLVTLDRSSIANLWPEDEVILTKEKMYDGKVMVK